MIISPPFLLPQAEGQSENDWIDACMNGDPPGRGAYPVSDMLCWHGGLHLEAPLGRDGQRAAVRAVADGVCVLARPPTPRPEDRAGLLAHAQSFGGGWSDNGVVVIRHDSEIGEGANAVVRFLSITMHLSAVDPGIRVGRTVHRKDVIGAAGQSAGMGKPGIHFEIVCDDDNLQRLIGRSRDGLSLATDGRSDALYGESYYFVPDCMPLFNARPRQTDVVRQADVQCRAADLQSRGTARPVAGMIENDTMTVIEFIVGIRYAAGSRHTMTYKTDGSIFGPATSEPRGEYGLYAEACLHSKIDSNAAADHGAATPAASAVFELLRYGRIVGPDALVPANWPHWHQVECGGGGWVNLNAAQVRKFSDADFPPWKGWRLIADSTGQDSRCDSPTIRRWLGGQAADADGHSQSKTRLYDDAVAFRLSRTICKTATEWTLEGFDKRWGWITSPSAERPEPMSATSFERLRAHVGALAFWDEAAIGLATTHWRFSPREFIKQFRQCRWLSAREFKQLMPTEVPGKNKQGTWVWQTVPGAAVDGEIARVQRVPLNKAMRKYLISSSVQRMASFIGNALQETDWLRTLSEYTKEGRYAPWYGRGILQLTWPSNYLAYWDYRGRSIQVTDAQRVALAAAEKFADKHQSSTELKKLDDALSPHVIRWRDDLMGLGHAPDRIDSPSESAGFFWAMNGIAEMADTRHELERTTIQGLSLAKPIYRSPAFWTVCACVNNPKSKRGLYDRPLNGFEARCVGYAQALAVLGESQFESSKGERLDFPEGLQPRRDK